MRRCGECTLCCRLLPVKELKKVAGQRCIHQRGRGCNVYHTPRMPMCCSVWNCRWLTEEEETAALARPDRSHYVIDVIPDFVQARDNNTGEVTPIPVLQVWIDPAYPDAHRDPAFRAYLEKKEMAALIRYNSGDGLTLFPPSWAADGEWHEVKGESLNAEHTIEDMYRAFALEVEVSK